MTCVVKVQAESTTNKAAGGCSYYSHVSVLLKLCFCDFKSAAEIVFLLYLVIIIKEVNNDV